MNRINIFWFRRDLRLNDNSGLYHALKAGLPVLPVFIFDRNILDKLGNGPGLAERIDRRVQFIHSALLEIGTTLAGMGSSLEICHATPLEAFSELLTRFEIDTVFANHDYEPYAKDRDEQVGEFLKQRSVGLQTYKDQVVFEKDEVLKEDGSPYTVFTPYSRKWKALLKDQDLEPYPTEKHFKNFLKQPPGKMPSLGSMGFKAVDLPFPPKVLDDELVRNYKEQRDFPSTNGTTRLSVHLRFGTLSIRTLARQGRQFSESFLNELIWRDFYQMILWHFPKVGKGNSFKPAYENIEWRRDEGEFEKWCNGLTGYPIVDAGMRELNATGFMHNRVRMIVASFLCKHLLLDWRLGEAYFAEKLLDFDLAANNGGWQWAAGSGCDAAPYFRIFNPYLQTEKFDPGHDYIRQWVPEYQEISYPKPIVQHEFARKRCLDLFAKGLRNEWKGTRQEDLFNQ